MDIGTTLVLMLGGLVLFLMAWAFAARGRRRARPRQAAAAAATARAAEEPGIEPGFEGVARRVEGRMAALEAVQADLAARLEGGGGAEDRLQAMAAQLLGLIRDKNATLETALAGLDQLRARMKTLEQMGSAAEARGLFEGLTGRLDALESAQAAAAAALEAGLAARRAQDDAPDPQVALIEQLTRLHAQKDTAIGTVIARLAPLESRLEARIEGVAAAQGAAGAALAALESGPVAEIAQTLARLHAQKDATAESLAARLETLEAALETRDPRGALDGFAARLDALQARLGALETPGENPFAEISAQLTRLYAQKDATTETVFARLAPLEARLAELQAALETRDPRGALDGFAARLDALQARLGALETPGENPFAEISAQLTRLYAQKDATTETVFARLAPLEARLAELQAALETRDPRGALDGFAARLDALQARLGALETPGENPFAEISAQLTRLYAQKDATTETVFARLAPLEARLAELQAALETRDPRGALDGFAARLDALQARLGALETPGENPFAEISAQLTRLYAQKDATTETVFARLAPLEARLAELQAALETRDPRGALDGFAARLDALQARLDAPGEHPFAEISEQLTRLYTQKDATVEAVLARLAPLEARLAEIEARDPRVVLDGFALRLEALQSRLGILETPGENPFAGISAQLAELYAQKDATVETVFARLAPLEARLAEIEARDPRVVLDGFALRLEALQSRLGILETPGENPFAGISAQLAELYAQKDATVETVFARLAPLEARLAELQARDPGAALDGFAARLDALQARLEIPGENPFAGVSEQLTRLYAQKDAAVEAVFARLAPLEARLAELQALAPQVAALAEADPRAALDDFAVRLETLHWTQGEVAAGLAALRAVIGDGNAAQPFAAIAEQLTRLHAQKDAALAAVEARLLPLEAKLAEMDARTQAGPGDAEEAARAAARAIADQLAELRAAAAQTELFADRLAMLEASLPRLNAAQSQMMRALERQAAGPAPAPAPTAPADPAPDADPFAAFRDLPRVVSLHHK